MSIFKARNGYHTRQDFDRRTAEVMSQYHQGKMGTRKQGFLYDGGEWPEDEPCVLAFRDRLAGFKGDLLDIGCGYGRWFAALKGCYGSYTGVDAVSGRIEFAQSQYPKGVFHKVGDVWDLEQRFDRIIMAFVIQHLVVDEAVNLLKRLEAHLTEGGEALLWEAHIIDGDLEVAEAFYKTLPKHMIPKPISLLQERIPGLKWQRVSEVHEWFFVVRRNVN